MRDGRARPPRASPLESSKIPNRDLLGQSVTIPSVIRSARSSPFFTGPPSVWFWRIRPMRGRYTLGCRSLLIQSKVTPVIATDKRLGANERLMSQLGERIVEVAPGRGTQIDCRLSTKIIRDRASDHVESGSVVYEDGLDEVTRRIEGKAQGHTPMRIAMVCDGEGERGGLSWRHVCQP